MNHTLYGLRLAILYGAIWFIDLLDASLLNIALPNISKYFQMHPTRTEWVLIGFLLGMIIGMLTSDPLGQHLGKRKTFLCAGWCYLFSSIGCGFSHYFAELVFFRIVQGISGGWAIPVGMTLVMTYMPQGKWAKTGSWLNVFALLAPALGPILAGYILSFLSWKWLFFVKLPISLLCVVLSHKWIKQGSSPKKVPVDFPGLFYVAISLSLLLLFLSEIGKSSFPQGILAIFLLLAVVFGSAFYSREKKAKHPLIPLKIFKFTLFSWGNMIQSAANMIFLGATFLIALYLQRGLGFSVFKTGWLMATITLGMAAVMPLTGLFYNQLGPLPFIIPGLIAMSLSMFGLIFITEKTPCWLISGIIFFEGAGSAALQTANFVSIFSEIPKDLKGVGSSLYSLFKQISASLGIALSTMMLTLQLGISARGTLSDCIPRSDFYASFLLLGCIPLGALLCCFKINNKKALQGIQSLGRLKTD